MFCSISNFLYIIKNLQLNLISLQPARNDRYDKSAVTLYYSTNINVLIHQRFVMVNESVPNFVIRDFRFTAPEHIDNYHHREIKILEYVLSLRLFAF